MHVACAEASTAVDTRAIAACGIVSTIVQSSYPSQSSTTVTKLLQNVMKLSWASKMSSQPSLPRRGLQATAGIQQNGTADMHSDDDDDEAQPNPEPSLEELSLLEPTTVGIAAQSCLL